jgi:hypothetical protein
MSYRYYCPKCGREYFGDKGHMGDIHVCECGTHISPSSADDARMETICGGSGAFALGIGMFVWAFVKRATASEFLGWMLGIALGACGFALFCFLMYKSNKLLGGKFTWLFIVTALATALFGAGYAGV